MSPWELPVALKVGGKEWEIRTDFRVILDILMNFSSPEFEPDEKAFICLDSLYEGYSDFLPDGEVRINMPPQDIPEALERAYEFIDMGIADDGKKKPHTMDWEQDAPIIIPAVNRVMGKEIRSLAYMHWWTFLGAYMEIGGDNLFSQIVGIRTKKAKGKRLEKREREFYQANRNLIDMKVKYSAEEIAARERLNKLLG